MRYLHFGDVFHTFKYPTGEIHVELKEEYERENSDEDMVIECHCRNAEDLFAVAMAGALLPKALYFLPYMPFSRHDHRRNQYTDGFPLDVVARMIGGMNILTVDPHSDVVANDVLHITQKQVVDFYRDYMYPNGDTSLTFVIPDAGASKKAYTWLREEDNVIQCVKKRDRATGKLSGFKIVPPDDEIGEHETFVIVDDICDGGGTFLGVKEAIASEMQFHPNIQLWVSHGMFQKDKLGNLLKGFNRIAAFDNYGWWREEEILRPTFEFLFRFSFPTYMENK